jgi:micrococcal nuclease
VIDGDTIVVELDGEMPRVRYIGIDTPETLDAGGVAACLGQEASDRNRVLVEGKTVELEKDVSETDQYGRLLRYVYAGGEMINERLVADGYAQVATYPPDVKHAERFLAAQQDARNAGRGLWGAICQQPPTSVPATPVTGPSADGCPQGCTVQPPGCMIKGNISQSSGEKIYHVPGGEFYSVTVISPSYGERWFCTEAEAVANGWRRSQR